MRMRFVTAAALQDAFAPPGGHRSLRRGGGWKPAHIELADEADLLLVAPATANTIAKLALGLADDALTCIALALNPAGQTADRPGHERQDVAAPGHPAERGHA